MLQKVRGIQRTIVGRYHEWCAIWGVGFLKRDHVTTIRRMHGGCDNEFYYFVFS